jgi:hypothetical protein
LHARLAEFGLPRPFYRIILSQYFRRAAHDNRVGWKTLGNHRIGTNHTISAKYQFAAAAYNRRPVADPAALTDANFAARCDALVANWKRDIFEPVVVIHNQHGRRKYDVPFNVNAISSGELNSTHDMTIIFDYEYGRTILESVGTAHTKMAIFSDVY